VKQRKARHRAQAKERLWYQATEDWEKLPPEAQELILKKPAMTMEKVASGSNKGTGR
jgi:hypothetical protein